MPTKSPHLASCLIVFFCLTLVPATSSAQVNPEIAKCEEIQDEATKVQAEFCAAHLGCRLVLKAHTACVKVKSFLQGLTRTLQNIGGGRTEESVDLDSLHSASRPAQSSLMEKTPQAVKLLETIAAQKPKTFDAQKTFTDRIYYQSPADQDGQVTQYRVWSTGQVGKHVFNKDGTVLQEIVNAATNDLRVVRTIDKSGRGWVAAEWRDGEEVGETNNYFLTRGSRLNKSTGERKDGIWSGEQDNQFLSGYIHQRDGQKTRHTGYSAELLYQKAVQASDPVIRQQYLAAMTADYPRHELTATLQAAPEARSGDRNPGTVEANRAPVHAAPVALPEGKVGLHSSICMRNLDKVHEPIKRGQIRAPQNGRRFWDDVYQLYFAILRPCAGFDQSAKSEIEWRMEALERSARQCEGREDTTLCSEWGTDANLNKTWYDTFVPRARQAVADPLNYSASGSSSATPAGAGNPACEAAYRKLETEIAAVKGRQPGNATRIQQLRLLLWMTDQSVQLGKGVCKGSARETELVGMQAQYSSAYKTCSDLATTPSVCSATVPW